MRSFTLRLVFAWALLSGAAPAADDTVFQFGTYSGLRAGAYEGELSCRRLKRFGNLGMGTFEGLDGEMIVLGDKVYQVPSDGIPRVADDNDPIPYAIVVPFRADFSIQVSQPIALKDLQKSIDALLPSPNYIYALRITGAFKWLDTRSVPRQRQPYPGIDEAIKQQVVFRLGNSSGTVVGFRFPSYIGGVNVAGYHCHYIAEDERSGGHLLDAVFEKGTVEVGRYTQFRMTLPETETFRQGVAPAQ